MKKILIPAFAIAAGFIFLPSCSNNNSVKKLETHMDSVSYANGIMFGTYCNKLLNDTNVNGNTELFEKAFSLAFSDDSMKFAMTREEANKISRSFDNELRQKEMMKIHSKKSAFEKERSEKAIENYKKDPDVKVTESGLMYKVITQGKGAIPKDNDTVEVNYEGRFVDGNVFDSSYESKKTFTTAVDGNIIQGWKEALKMMPVGSTWELLIPADLAYGDGIIGRMPGNAALFFKIEVIKIVENK